MRNKTNSRERFYSTINKLKTDRPPIDVYGMEEDLMQNLVESLNLKNEEALYQYLLSDFRTIWVDLPIRFYKGCVNSDRKNENEVDYWGMPLTDNNFHSIPYGDTIINRPLSSASTLKQVEAYTWPDASLFDFCEIKNECSKYDNSVIRRVVAGPLFNKVCELCGIETTLENLILEPHIIEAITERITAFYCELYENIFNLCSEFIDVFCFWDDVATHRGLFFNIEIWRKLFKKNLLKIFEIARKNDIIVQYHCCGVMKELIPDLLEIGMEILEPCQLHLQGMDGVKLKKEYGKELTFFGGINTSETLPFGTPMEVRREVRYRINTMGKNGGYIVAPDHVLQNNIPIQNVLALFEEACQ